MHFHGPESVVGLCLKNKHNGRLTTIIKFEYADNGVILYSCEDGRYLTNHDLENHWERVKERTFNEECIQQYVDDEPTVACGCIDCWPESQHLGEDE